MRKSISFKGLWKALKYSFANFGKDKIMKLSASLAYYTIFSIGPLLIVIVFLAGIFYGEAAVKGTISDQLQTFIGPGAAEQLQEILKNAAVGEGSTFAAIIGIGTLIIGATTMFADMQDSLNSIWGLRPNPEAPWYSVIISRLISFGLVATLGFLLLVSLTLSAFISAFSMEIQEHIQWLSLPLVNIGDTALSFIIITALFLIIFKVLPDARIHWKDVLSGAIATSVLFMAGKFAISFYISISDIASTYGAAGSLIILLVWVYYSSVILYFGAEFTKAFAMEFGSSIHPTSFAVIAKKIEVREKDSGKSLQRADAEAKQEEKERNGGKETPAKP